MMMKLTYLSTLVAFASGACPGASMPSLSAAQTASALRTKTLGHVPTDADIASAVNVQRIKRIMTEAQFAYLFPRANADAGPGNGPYSYANFLKAAAMWPAFCGESGNASDNLDTICAREMSSMFAMWAQEVGGHDTSSPYPDWRQALYWFEEIGCAASGACVYCNPSTDNPCTAGQTYYGRGSYQLTYNYNYGPFSYAMFGDRSVLLNNPGLLVQTGTAYGWLSFASALWFHMTPQTPKPSMHEIVSNFWVPNAADKAAGRLAGFGAMTMVINGAVECSKGTETAQSANRLSYYKSFAAYFNIDPLANTGCATMAQFDASSSASMAQGWEQSWTSTCACQLVTYQTTYSIFDNPSNPSAAYQNCLNQYYAGQTTAKPTGVTTAAPVTTAATTAKTTATAATTKATTAAPTTKGTTAATTAAPTTKATTGGSTAATTKGTTATTVKPTTAATTAKTTVAPVTTAKTTTKSSTAAATGVCNFTDCLKCSSTGVAGVSNDQCSACLWSNGEPFCGKSGSCVCSARVSDYKPCGSSCTTSCKAIPGNRQSTSDADCSACKGPNPQAWWPCNQAGLCQCA